MKKEVVNIEKVLKEVAEHNGMAQYIIDRRKFVEFERFYEEEKTKYPNSSIESILEDFDYAISFKFCDEIANVFWEDKGLVAPFIDDMLEELASYEWAYDKSLEGKLFTITGYPGYFRYSPFHLGYMVKGRINANEVLDYWKELV